MTSRLLHSYLSQDYMATYSLHLLHLPNLSMFLSCLPGPSTSMTNDMTSPLMTHSSSLSMYSTSYYLLHIYTGLMTSALSLDNLILPTLPVSFHYNNSSHLLLDILVLNMDTIPLMMSHLTLSNAFLHHSPTITASLLSIVTDRQLSIHSLPIPSCLTTSSHSLPPSSADNLTLPPAHLPSLPLSSSYHYSYIHSNLYTYTLSHSLLSLTSSDQTVYSTHSSCLSMCPCLPPV